MEPLDHDEGFENERRFRMIAVQATRECPDLMRRTVKRIIAHFDPEFVRDLYKVRPCVRKLRYVGCGCVEDPCPDGPDHFKMGKVYESIDFNGGTYTIKGYMRGKRRIGAAYFERVT